MGKSIISMAIFSKPLNYQRVPRFLELHGRPSQNGNPNIAIQIPLRPDWWRSSNMCTVYNLSFEHGTCISLSVCGLCQKKIMIRLWSCCDWRKEQQGAPTRASKITRISAVSQGLIVSSKKMDHFLQDIFGPKLPKKSSWILCFLGDITNYS